MLRGHPSQGITAHTSGALQLPAGLSAGAASLLNSLLSPSEEQRLAAVRGATGSDGNGALRAHPWFAGFDWRALAAGTMAAPWTPPATDVSPPEAPSEENGIFYGGPPPSGGPAVGYLQVDEALRQPCVVDPEARWLDSF